MVKHAHSILLPLDINQTYDIVFYYFPQQGFCMKSTLKPTSIVFERGNNWTAHNFKTFHSILKININSSTIGTSVVCEYEISGWAWSPKWVEEIKNEVEGLHNAVQQLGITSQNHIPKQDERDRKCVKCQRQIPWDANICPYCGHDFSNKKESKDNNCPYCGSKNNPDYNFCIKCKKSLSEVK